MLEYFFEAPYRLRQLRRKPLCHHIEALAEKLLRLGFTRGSGQRILGLVGKFNEFAGSVGVENPDCIDEGLVTRFFEDELPSEGTFADAPTVMRHLLTHLRDQGFVSKEVSTEVVDSFQPILDRYNVHLRDVCGLTESSRANYLRYARRLMSWLQNRHGDRPLTELAGVDVVGFVTELAPLHPSGSWRNDLCSLTRVFLRYLRWEGTIHIDLDRVVPKLPRWRLSGTCQQL